MMASDDHRASRITAVAAATVISLACGSNYAYSAWGPQFASRLQLSATQSNVIGVMGNVGMYVSGIPIGLLVDNRGPRPAVFMGGIFLGLGYLPISLAYDAGPGSVNIVLIAFFSFLTGLGGCAAFLAAIKAAALNWPHHRGTATGLPLAAFGLSALFFTLTAGIFFPGNTSALLLYLAIATAVMTLASLPFLRVPPVSPYVALPASTRPHETRRRPSNQMHHTKPEHLRVHDEPSKPHALPTSSSSSEAGWLPAAHAHADDHIADVDSGSDDASSLLSAPGDIDGEDAESKHSYSHSHHLDVSGPKILRHVEFYQLFILLGLLTGVGLMTINNIGNDAQALWSHWDASTSKEFIAHRQLMHVSIISLFSFFGRLLSGIGSDFLVKRMQMSRFWCVSASASVFILAQVAGMCISNPHFLWVLSALNGLAYGALFGAYPALVADTFGVSGLSLNWGCMILSPVIFGNVFNIAYGRIFDSHSVVDEKGALVCKEGLDCYRGAYSISIIGAVLGLAFSLWCVWHENSAKRVREMEGRNDHQA